MNQDGVLGRKRVLTADISLGSFAVHVRAIADLGEAHRSSYVCCVNAHMTAEARDPGFASVVNGADLATADGMPVLYAMRLFHGVDQERVAGNDLLPALLSEAHARKLKVFLYGGRQEVLDAMVERAGREFPGIEVCGAYSPPFAALEEMDLAGDAERINASGAHLVFVSLGCPKQERWMAAMKGRVQGVMLGLGGAFLLYAGMDTRAPKWMRDLSLEWCYRLWLEPGRLWKRYLVTNSIFLGLFLKHGIHRLLGR
ncbi:MAG: WecB/TagA/CpsF family glycosyltransferase [Flavobacteriales bacterium]|nr:WecB/TagA/CpsF family glycosyltransferase [Flavobacteriales bacterium]MCB0783040.1 WecB/TagA/CpsF family glycosyltransferase [Flavobacteriales bacterium]MCB0787689.1 WecB/TagA/CpsF family glycosyltransferase [Flavobacteriales bacterium]HPF66138.1 WecB/TagA/CpsF family glycosyltransferase [Flavobacteriales bacterium]HPQ57056.1 WecB/TagA/CpsF family glycosyltransferase [Flavobacteriales bacterium]